jgi:hypothetical protein
MVSSNFSNPTLPLRVSLGARPRCQMYVPHPVPHDPSVGGQVPHRGHQGSHFRAGAAKSRDGAGRRGLGHPVPLFGQARPLPM